MKPLPAFVAVLLPAVLVAALAGCTGLLPMPLGDYLAGIPRQMPSPIPAGTHTGSYIIALPPGAVAMYRHFEVQVVALAGDVSAINILEPDALAGDASFQQLAADVALLDTLSLDAVSGATVSSVAFLKAVEDALRD